MGTIRGNKVRLYVPSKDRRGKRVKNRKAVAEVEALFARSFGGCTRWQGVGTYVSAADRLIKEEVVIVESNATDEELKTHLPALRALAEKMKVDLNQEAVALEINGVLEFV